jgi:DNA-binding MarR family transcriptional regulator
MSDDDLDGELLDVRDWWPPMRVPAADTKVIAAVHGAEHAVATRLGYATRVHGLDVAEALVLATIRVASGCAPWELRRRLGLHRSTLSSILDRLERAGRIERHAPDGIRRFDIRLTPAGRTDADLATYVIGEVEAEIASYTSKQERHGALAVFEACLAIGHRERGVSE